MTELLYLKDFNVEACTGTTLLSTVREDGRSDLILNQTCFYPRGGGQDWDEGTLSNSSTTFIVNEVRLDGTGVVHHIGTYSKGTFEEGDSVAGQVDIARRRLNSRLHSAAHVIDMAISSLGLDWIGTKGQHYPHLSAVEYSGTWQPEKAEELQAAIEQRANELIQRGTENRIAFMPVSEMHTVCRHVPANIPTNKPARVVIYGDNFGIPCGGTHVKTLDQIGSLTYTQAQREERRHTRYIRLGDYPLIPSNPLLLHPTLGSVAVVEKRAHLF